MIASSHDRSPGSHRPARSTRRWTARLLRRFGADRKGATAVEFGLISLPFMFMLMMIVETSMAFWTRQVLQEATAQASRTILTGEARTLYTGSVAVQTAAFRDAICARMNLASDCSTRLFIDVQPESSFPATPNSMVTSGTINTASYQMRAVGPGEIVVIRTAYKIPVLVAGYFGSLSRLSSGENVLESVVAFRSEPFPTT